MTIYYVATDVCRVLVSADDRWSAWMEGHAALHPLHAALSEQSGQDLPVKIQTIHVATTEEIANETVLTDSQSREVASDNIEFTT